MTGKLRLQSKQCKLNLQKSHYLRLQKTPPFTGLEEGLVLLPWGEGNLSGVPSTEPSGVVRGFLWRKMPG